MVPRWISSVVILLLVLIIGGLLGSRIPIFGQAGKVSGTYELTLTDNSGNILNVLATANSEGIIIGTSLPLDCLTGYTLTNGYGTWGIGVEGVQFEVHSLLFQNGQKVGTVILRGRGDALSRTGTGELILPPGPQGCAFQGPFKFTTDPVVAQ